MRDWYDAGSWAPTTANNWFWEDVPQSIAQRQDREEWRWRVGEPQSPWLERAYFVTRTLGRTVKGTKVPALEAFQITLPGGTAITVGPSGGSAGLGRRYET